ncbi:MAG: DAK2 domain-containing protein [Monoglobus pectinilyticus]
MIQLDSKSLKLMIASASNQILNNVEKVNDMNVFPVPDGDTGTNMSMTFSAAAKSVVDLDNKKSPVEVLGVLSKSALRNARGNSGVILSQILRGLWQGAEQSGELDVSGVKHALCEARDTAYRAVMKPTEGTILTVIREIAEYAEAHFVEYDDVTLFLKAVLEAGRKSLAKTKEILPVLKQVGVVDAGGFGVIILLGGAVSALESGKAAELEESGKANNKQIASQGIKSAEADTSDIKFRYCTEFLINKDSERSAAQLMAAIKQKGDCMLVIDDDEIVKVHIHTNHPGFVLEQALKLGELTSIKIDNMKYQHNEIVNGSQEEDELSDDETELKKYGFVAVSSGDGLSQLFESLNCDKIVAGGQTMNPSTQDILDAVLDVKAENVFVLPNNKNIILAAEQVKELTDVNVIVIPTKNMPQGLAAIAVFNEDADLDENIFMMNESADLVKCGQVTYAVRDTRINGVDVENGDIMAVIGSDLSVVGSDVNEVAKELAEKLVDEDSGVISIYYGKDIEKEKATELSAYLENKYSDLDVNLNYGGQNVYYYIIAVE